MGRKDRIVVVAMVRDPLAQIKGWQKAPYGMTHCVAHCAETDTSSDCVDGTAWLVRPCSFKGYQPGKQHQGKGRSGGNFSSLPDIWNSYVQGYLRLRALGGYKAMEIIRFEDLVLD